MPTRKIAQAVFATQGDAAYPDGTFTLRLSYGQVKGYMENGKPVTPFTEIRGLYIRGDEHKQKPPYKIADSWMKARAVAESDHALQLRQHQRHRRRQQRLAGDQREGRAGRD